jgi:hypothetical protein
LQPGDRRAGRVEDRRCRTAAANRGPVPYSSIETAEVSIAATQPAPIRTSAWILLVGTHTICRAFTRRRTSSRVAAMATPKGAFGIASFAPSGIAAASVARSQCAFMGAAPVCVGL